MTNIYRLSLLERFTTIDSGLNQKYIDVDGVGILVSYNKEVDLVAKTIRKCIIGRRDTYCFVEANSIKESKEIFKREWVGAKVGTKSPALWINSNIRVQREKSCKYRHKNKQEEYTCGESKDKKLNGEYGMCCIDGYDTYDYDFCPYNEKN